MKDHAFGSYCIFIYYGNHKTQPINARHLTPLTKPGKKCDNATGSDTLNSSQNNDLASESDMHDKTVDSSNPGGPYAPLLDYPKVWSAEQWLRWQKKLPWLRYENELLGFSVCSEIQKVAGVDKRGVHVSREWSQGIVSVGNKRKLKEKIYQHLSPGAHNMADETLKMKEKHTLQNCVQDANSHLFAETVRVFRTAYAAGKMNMPFTCQKTLIQLQEINGLDMGRVHRSDHSCAAILKHIATGMKKNLCAGIKGLSPHVALMLDESTLFKTAVIVLFLCTRLMKIDEIDACNSVENVFLGLVEATAGTTTDGVFSAVHSELQQNGFDDEWPKSNLIAICTDGASVMTGSKSGVAPTFVKNYGLRVETFHCLARRLELAVHDSLKSVNATNHFKIFISTLHSLFSQSPKNLRQPKDAACDTHTQLLNINGIFTIRWVSSSFRAVRAVWRNYGALFLMFQTAADDYKRSGTDRAKFRGMLDKLSTASFLMDLALMKDALRELSSLSLRLQSRTATIATSCADIAKTVRVFEAMKVAGGGKSVKVAQLACDAELEDERLFKSVKLNKRGKSGIHGGQFLTAIVDNLKARLSDGNSDLVSHLQVLDPALWPNDDSRLLYGEQSVVTLAKRLKLESRPTVEQFRKLKDGKQPESAIKKLMTAAATYPGTSAECERGFSTMNDIAWDKRNALHVQTVSDLMFLALNGPPLEKFEPLLTFGLG